MPRPRRAAAARAAAVIHNDSDSESTPISKAQKTETTPSPRRRLRRAVYRTGKRGQRPLQRRRADFERIANHILALNTSQSSNASASLTEFGSEEGSQEFTQVSLTPAFAQKILDEGDDQQGMIVKMKALLKRLTSLDNINEEDGIEGAKKNRPDDDDDLHALAGVLCAERFVSHDSSQLKLLTACAMAEVLRICAPDPPVEIHKLNRICSLFVEQLAVLVSERDDMEVFRFSLLEQLACVKTFVIFCDDEDVVCDLFACFYATVKAHQPDKVRQYFADILVSMVDEAETLGYAVLDALVAPLIPALEYSEEAVGLARKVVHAASNAIQVPLCSMLNASVRRIRPLSLSTPERGKKKTPAKRRQEGDEGDVELSTHHEHIAELIVGLNRIASELLIYVVPGLEDRIRSADEEVRLGNVGLLARLFTSKKDMVEAYPSLFEEFLTRHKDVSPRVRAEVCTAAAELIVRHPRYRKKLDEMLRDRVLDRDENVRVAAVRAIGAGLGVASEELLQALATRLRDRKEAVRKAAMTHLTKFYSSGDSQVAQNSESDGGDETDGVIAEDDVNVDDVIGADESPPDSGGTQPKLDVLWLRKSAWIPDQIVQAHMALRNYADANAAREVEQVIFDGIPRPDSYSTEASICRFAMFVGSLSAKTFAQIVQLVNERRRCLDALRDLALFRIRSRKKGNGGTEKPPDQQEEGVHATTFSRKSGKEDGGNPFGEPPLASAEIQAKYSILSRFFNSATDHGETALKLCSSLAGAPDLKIFEKLLIATDVEAEQDDRTAAYHDVLARVGSKSALGCFLRDQLFPKSLPGVFTASHFAQACTLAKSAADSSGIFKSGDVDIEVNESSQIELCGMLRYLELASQHAAELLGHNVDHIQSLVTATDSAPDLVLVGLRLLARLPKDTRPEKQSEELQQTLTNLMLEKKPLDIAWSSCLAKWATRAFISMHQKANGEVGDLVSDFLSTLVAKFSNFDGDVEAIIAPITCLSQIARHDTSLFKRVALECFDFVRALLCGSFNDKLSPFWHGIDLQKDSAPNLQNSVWRRCAVPVKSEEELLSMSDLQDRRALCLSVLVHRAVKVLVYGLDSVDADDELDNVFEILLDIILAKNGNAFSIDRDELVLTEEDEDSSTETLQNLYACSRLSAGHGMLFLARHPKHFRKLSPPLFVSVILLSQDESPEIRLSFVRTIVNMILKKRLPFRWIVALSLMSVDPVRENVIQIRGLLTTLVRHRRRVFEKARLDVNRSNSFQLLPEIAVPELIWVLANLPDVEVDREAGFPESEKCLEFLMERLLESNEYAGVLHEYIESLSIAQDATEAEDAVPGVKTEMICELARVAGNILKKIQTGRKWSLEKHPGSVSLPKDMFRVINRNAETSGVPPPSLLAVARKYDKDERIHSDKKLKPSHAVSNITSVEPIKLMKEESEEVMKKDDEFDEQNEAEKENSMKQEKEAENDAEMGEEEGKEDKEDQGDKKEKGDGEDEEDSGRADAEEEKKDELEDDGEKKSPKQKRQWKSRKTKKKAQAKLGTRAQAQKQVEGGITLRRSARNRRM